MKNKIYKALSILLYIVSIIIVLFCIKIRITPGMYLNIKLRLILLTIVCLLLYINNFILIKKLNYNKKILKINIILIFLVYIFTIFNLTLLDERFGRGELTIAKWDSELLQNYIKTSFNIIPFNTIKLFTNGYIRGYVSTTNFLINIIGNFVAFMPFGIFLPLLFKKMNKYYKFLIIMIIIVATIEILQFLTLSGSCDIDDLILNIMGASAIYGLYKIKSINKLVNKVILFE